MLRFCSLNTHCGPRRRRYSPGTVIVALGAARYPRGQEGWRLVMLVGAPVRTRCARGAPRFGPGNKARTYLRVGMQKEKLGGGLHREQCGPVQFGTAPYWEINSQRPKTTPKSREF